MAWLLGQDPGDLINLADPDPEAEGGLAGRLGGISQPAGPG